MCRLQIVNIAPILPGSLLVYTTGNRFRNAERDVISPAITTRRLAVFQDARLIKKQTGPRLCHCFVKLAPSRVGYSRSETVKAPELTIRSGPDETTRDARIEAPVSLWSVKSSAIPP